MDIAGKWTSLASQAPEDPILYPDRDSLAQFARLRFNLSGQWNDRLNGELAYEQRARWASTPAAGTGLLPSNNTVPYRVVPLDWQIDRHGDKSWYRHEIDRAYAAWHPSWGDVTIGRQAVGLGRGVIFSVMDMFAPFSPLDVDREWRRGVDAARWEVRVSDTSSLELLGIFGETWEQSAVLGRARGYFGEIDGEIVLGKRAEDTLIAGSVSAIVSQAEVHAELGFYHTPEVQRDGGFAGRDYQVLKAVVGSSYTFDVGNGLTMLGEFHYNGFGAQDTSDLSLRLLNGDFQQRVLRGDMQVLARQALALQASYPFKATLNGSLLLLQCPQDGSGLVTPYLAWDLHSNLHLLSSVYVPWGEKPQKGQVQSLYGGTPLSLFLQLAGYW